MKVVLSGNSDIVIYNFRQELIERLISENIEVHILTPYGPKIEMLMPLGIKFHDIKIERHGMNPAADFKLIMTYIKAFREIKPDCVFSYTIKPNLYGGIACEFLNIPYIPNVTGLGMAAEKNRFIQKMVTLIYKLAFRQTKCVFVQNEKIRRFLTENRIASDRLKLLPGSGVNPERFLWKKYPEYPPYQDEFLFAGRVMKDKGIEEYLSTAKNIKKEYPDVKFGIAGFLDGDYQKALEEAEKKEWICYYGYQQDMKALYEKCSAVVLPSYHEGMANVLLEAAASGRPVLASNIPGCREAFEEGITGFGFEPKNAESLYRAIKKFIEMENIQKAEMGREARKKMVEEFNRRLVVDAYMEELRKVEETINVTI